MSSPPARTLHYVRSWLWNQGDVVSREVALDRAGTSVPATLLTPSATRGPLPAWIVLHGITRPGRAHKQLVRFTRAVAAGGCAVLVPEVPEWRALDLAPGLTLPTVQAGLSCLEGLGLGNGLGGTGLLGFSFGAPQAIAASAHPSLVGRLAGVAGFGGYCELERTVVFQFTGRHEWNGETHHLRPDPYGRWIVGANYLTAVPGLEDAGELARGLRHLAAQAGDLSILSWAPDLDATKAEIRAGLPDRMRPLFDLFAPHSSLEPDPVAGEEMAHALAAAGRAVHPDIEPAPYFTKAPGPIRLLHGRQDHLIPFTEALRLQAALPGGIVSSATVTRLFGHSSQDPMPGWVEGAKEGVRFLRALTGILGVVGDGRRVSASVGGGGPPS